MFCMKCNMSLDIREKQFCCRCRHAGWLHPRDLEGNIDYSRVIPCECRLVVIEQDKARNSRQQSVE